MSLRGRLTCVPALLLAALSFGCGRGPAKPAEYKIGAVLSQTGRGATYAEKAENGMKLALDELNAGDFKETPLRLIIKDSNSTGEKALEAFREILDDDQVFAAIGFLLSDEVLACAPFANQRKIVLFSPFAGSDDIKNAGDFVFRNRESAGLQAEAIAKAAIERFGKRKLAVLHSNSANGISYRESFVDAALEAQVPLPATVGFDEGKSDYRREIERIRSEAPDGVYLAGLDRELALILKESAAMGFAPQFFASAAAITPKLLEIAGPSAEGLICGSAPFDADSEEPRIQAFVSAYEKSFGAKPDFLSANSYDAIHILARLIREGADSGESLKKGLYAVKDYPGIGGNTTFDSFGEVNKPISLVQVKDGAFRPLP